MDWTLLFGGGSLNWGGWFYGLAQAFIRGGSTSASTGITTIIVDPKDFNLQTGKFWAVVGISFMIGAATNFFSYLQSSPLPTVRSQSTTQTITPTGTTSITKSTTEVTLPPKP